MATIKEKSKEYANEQGLRMAYNGSCDNCQQGFVAGANYVLDEIDNFIFNTIQMKDVIEPHLILIKIRKKFKELKGE